MKRLLFILIVLPLLVLSSCNKEDESIWGDQTSSERMQKQADEFMKLLTAGDGTWIIENFPHENLNKGGWIFIVTFTQGEITTNVYSYFEGARYITGEIVNNSEFKLIPREGIVLTFNTFNTYLHLFSYLVPPLIGSGPHGQYGTDDQGIRGDYEFSLIEGTDTYFRLKGAKTFNYANMYKLPSGYTPEQYIDECLEVQTALIGGTYRMEVEGETVGKISRGISYTKLENLYAAKTFLVSHDKYNPLHDTDPTAPEFISVSDGSFPVCYKLFDDGATKGLTLYNPFTYDITASRDDDNYSETPQERKQFVRFQNFALVGSRLEALDGKIVTYKKLKDGSLEEVLTDAEVILRL
jgi:hypothetical protein